MFKGKPSKPNGLAISIIEAEPSEYSLMPQDMLLAGLRDIALGLPEKLLNHTVDQYLQEEQPQLMPNHEVDHPKHYREDSGLEAIEVIEAWDLNFNLGNVVKYVCRAGLKDKADREEDLEKARWYLSRELNQKD
jgi:hypothetical protein